MGEDARHGPGDHPNTRHRTRVGTAFWVNLFDTIVAPITGTEPAAVAVVRVSGPQSYAVAEKVFSPWHEPVEARKALYGT
ncbi:MAG: hypothetical protein K8H99_06825, partial [Nitrospirae bacterium]|nr:hypothetical protein [Fimbriimonadaceae bacterium]